MAEEYLDSHGYKYKRVDVRRHPVAMEELRALSGQISTPTLVVEDLILPDFGPEELEDFLKEHNILP
jgi:glutaredoxin 3